MTSLRNLFAISAIVVSSNSFAATEFPGDLVPGDVAKEFSSGKIYSSLPDNFPVPVLPAGTPLYVLGSVDNTYTQRLLLGTTLTGAEVRRLMIAGYAPAGWVDVSVAPTVLDLCHDTLGILHFQMTTPIGSQSRIVVNRSIRIPTADSAMTCAEQLAYQNGGPATTPYMIFFQAVPQLALPPTASPNTGIRYPFGISSGSGIGGTSYRSESDFTVDIPNYSLGQLQAFFAAQMMEKGWSRDGGFVGDKSASSVWFKKVPIPVREPAGVPTGYATEMLLTASLQLLNVRANAYTVSLTVSTGESQRLPAIGIRGISPL